MGLFDLGRRVLRHAKQQGQHLWQDVGQEWEQISPHLKRIRQEILNRSHLLRNQISHDVFRWLEEELRISMGRWRTLLGQDPELAKAYHTLELPYGTQLEEVKLQWKELLKTHHPDRHMSNPQQHANATQKSQHLTAAYHVIAKAFREHRL